MAASARWKKCQCEVRGWKEATYRLANIVLSQEELRSEIFFLHGVLVDDGQAADAGEGQVLGDLSSECAQRDE